MRSPTRSRTTDRSRGAGACCAAEYCGAARTIGIAAAAAQLRVHEPVIHIHRGVVDAGFEKGVMALATLAASAAVYRRLSRSGLRRIHTRLRPLERNAERCAATDQLRLAHRLGRLR